MAATLTQTFRVTTLQEGGGKISANLTEEVETEQGTEFNPRTNITVALDSDTAGKFLPGTRFTVTFTKAT